jgi:hypothetical protein
MEKVVVLPFFIASIMPEKYPFRRMLHESLRFEMKTNSSTTTK